MPSESDTAQGIAAIMRRVFAQPDGAHGDVMGHGANDAPRLVTAQDIACARIAEMPADTVRQRMQRAAAFLVETQRAKDELARGEWQLPRALPTSSPGTTSGVVIADSTTRGK